jgi:hypothetical protein
VGKAPESTVSRIGKSVAAAAAVELAAVVGLFANILQLESLFTAGIGGVVRLLAELTAFVIGAAILAGTIRRGTPLAVAWVGVAACVFIVISTLVLAPHRDQSRTAALPQTRSPEDPTTTAATTSTAASRSTAQWASDINGVCRDHLSTAGLALQSMQGMTDKLNTMVGSVDILDPTQADRYIDGMTAAIGQTMPAMENLNTAYLVIAQSSQSIEPPTLRQDAEEAEAWLQKYEQRAQAWADTVSHFRDFLRDTNRTVRGVDLFQAFLKSREFVKVNPTVTDLSAKAGIVSCP